MQTILFFVTAAVALAWLVWRWRLPPSRDYGSVDANVPAFNEELCIGEAVLGLLQNRYINQVIIVHDGSMDGTAELIDRMADCNDRVVAVHQGNTGKGDALMAGLARSAAPYVFLTDADTVLPHEGDGLGYMIAEMERGADAVGGYPTGHYRARQAVELV